MNASTYISQARKLAQMTDDITEARSVVLDGIVAGEIVRRDLQLYMEAMMKAAIAVKYASITAQEIGLGLARAEANQLEIDLVL